MVMDTKTVNENLFHEAEVVFTFHPTPQTIR